jgi:acyl-CoA carboxylase epsilon subunit
MNTMPDPGTDLPTFTVVKGSPTPAELAALVMVLMQSAQAADTPSIRPVSQWSAYWRSLRAPLTPGPGAWRQSARRG